MLVSYSQGKDEIFFYMSKGTDLPEFRLPVNSFLYLYGQYSTIWIGISWWKTEIYQEASNVNGSS